MSFFIDSHFHLPMLVNEKRIPFEIIEKELVEKNVKRVLSIISSREEREYINSVNNMITDSEIVFDFAAGIHPHNAENYDRNISWISEMKENIVAVGESGMDLHYCFSPENQQVELFEKMVELSIELEKPLIIHGRSAEEKIVDILKNYSELKKNVLFHCYTGDINVAKTIMDNGWYISFSGIVTFKKPLELKEVIKALPLDRIIFETDSPFMAPVPFRGKVNTPAKVSSIYEYSSELLNIEIDSLTAQIKDNYYRLFEIDEK